MHHVCIRMQCLSRTKEQKKDLELIIGKQITSEVFLSSILANMHLVLKFCTQKQHDFFPLIYPGLVKFFQ